MKAIHQIAAAVCALAVVSVGYCNPPRIPHPKKALRIRPSEVSRIAYVKYRDPSGYFSMNIPRGWVVRTGIKPSGKIDLIKIRLTEDSALADKNQGFPKTLSDDGCHPNPDTYFIMEEMALESIRAALKR